MSQPGLFNRAAIVGSMLAMVSIGALIASYGPAIAGFKARFGLTDADAGAGLALQSVGAVVGVVAAPWVLRKFGNRAAMSTALVLIAIGATAIAFAPHWSVLLVAATTAGLGVGAIDLLVSQLLITGTGARGPALMNLAHAFFGIGTVASPALTAVVGSDSYMVVFMLFAVCALAALLTMPGLKARPTPMDTTPATSAAVIRPTRRIGVLLLSGFIILYIAHFGVQSGIGNWEPTYLVATGFGQSTAVWATSGFWMAMVLGRFVAAGLTRHIAIPQLVTLSCVGMTAALVIAHLEGTATWAFLLCGFFIGPIFPNGLTWLAHSGYGQGPSFAYVIAASMVGMAVAPWAIGVHIEYAGTQVLPSTLLAIALIALAVSIALAILTSRLKHGRIR